MELTIGNALQQMGIDIVKADGTIKSAEEVLDELEKLYSDPKEKGDEIKNG